MPKEVIDPDFLEEERFRLEHEELHRKHMGHDVMHAEMFIIFIIAMIVAQVILFLWKRKHFRSYQRATLIALWVIPFLICVRKGWWRFVITWFVFSGVSLYIWRMVTRPIISGRAPRLVYKYFLFLHKLSYVLGIGGYFALMSGLMGINVLFWISTNTIMDIGVCLLFYGLYYGVLGRDFAHICTDMLACKIGYYTQEGLPKRILENGVCAVCGDPLKNAKESEEIADNSDLIDAEEKTYTLTCQHTFHEFCIRGWCVVGKLQTCPYCKEKVDLKRMFKNPWEKPHLFYGQLLDWIRYLVAWQPLIVGIVQGINRILGLE